MEYTYIEFSDATTAAITDALQRIYKFYIPIIICVGTDAAIGDALGPLVGTKLKESFCPAFIYGSLGKTITAKEISTIKKFVSCVHPLAKTLVIDAAVGDTTDIGKIKVSDNGIFPGLGADKNLPEIGDGSVIGIVSERSENNHAFMNMTRLSPIYSMAEKIADGILDYIRICDQKPAYKPVNGTFSKL